MRLIHSVDGRGSAVMRAVVSVHPKCDAESADSAKLASDVPRLMSVLVMTSSRLSCHGESAVMKRVGSISESTVMRVGSVSESTVSLLGLMRVGSVRESIVSPG